MQIIHHIIIDLAQRRPVAPVDAVQGDGNTRILRLTLLENGTEWTVPEGTSAAVAFRKPDGTKGLYDTLPDGTKAVTMEGSTVSAVLAPQVLTCPGEVTLSVVFHDEKLNQLATFPFIIRVEKNPAAGQTPSNDYYYYSTMADISKAMEEAVAAMEQETQAFLAKAEEALQTVHDTATDDAPAIVCEAAGEVITVTDASNRPLKGLSIYGKTTQNGTPTSDAPVPLESVGEAICVTVAGKNLIRYPYKEQEKTANGVTLKANADGGVTGSGTATGYVSLTLADFPVDTLECITAGAFGTFSNLLFTVDLLDGSNSIIYSLSTDTPTTVILSDYPNAEIIRFSVKRKNNAAVSGTMYPMVTAGPAVPAEYEAPKAVQTITASAEGGLYGIPVTGGGNYTDADGQQWLCDEIDFARGVKTKNVISEIPLIASHYTEWGLYCQLSNKSIPNQKVLCSHAHDAVIASSPTLVRIPLEQLPAFVVDIATGQEWITNHSVTVLYPLAEPVETPLSEEELAQFASLHTNKPSNTVFNDSGAEMQLSYVADTKTYIDQKIAAISAAMLT